MNIEIGAEAALFPEKEYIKGIFVAVDPSTLKIIGGSLIKPTSLLISGLRKRAARDKQIY
jgi:hypothetical protein